MTKQKPPTLAQIKAANPEFFSHKNDNFFGTHTWKKAGHIISSIGNDGFISRRWVDYDTLKLCVIWEVFEEVTAAEGGRNIQCRIFITRRDEPEDLYQEIDCRGEFIGEPLTSEEFYAIPRA